MYGTTKTIVFCETIKLPRTEPFFALFKQGLTEADFERYKFLQLLKEGNDLQPYVIVCDFGASPFKQAVKDIEALRKAFPGSGLIIYYEGTEIEPETLRLQFVTCHNQLAIKMAAPGYVTRELVNRAFNLVQSRSVV